MPVKVRCKFCDWVFNVTDALAGGKCRCKHCGQVVEVDGGAEIAQLARPQTPPRRQAKVDPVTAAPTGVLSEIGRWMRIRQWFGVAAVLIVAIAVAAWAVVVRGIGRGDSSAVKVEPALVQVSPRDVARVPDRAAVDGKLREFCEIPIHDARIAWIVDGSVGMRMYYADITTLIATAMRGLSPMDQQTGLLLAKGDSGETLNMSAALEPTIEAARHTMQAFAPLGSNNLLKALRTALEWKPQAVFLIVAQRSDFLAKSEFVSAALAAKAKIHVVALGEERLLGWAFLPKATGGEFRVMSLSELQRRVSDVLGVVDEGPISPPRLRRGE